MLLQMPILVALWTALNSDIQLRHAPLDGWWIRDLAAPDALVQFGHPITIPILGQLPLLGRMFSGIDALNLLPILMGVSMWLQQKYMPKPSVHARPGATPKPGAAPRPAERRPGQLSPEDQLRQQRIMSYMMVFIFPLMFYYMPAGLNLYWMATNVFGIGESLIIRKQLAEEKARRERAGPPPPGQRRTGLFARILKRLAEQAEEIQRKADDLGKPGPGRSGGGATGARPGGGTGRGRPRDSGGPKRR
jgi:YidC/Oxa1 family membrane protein insertase